MEIEENPNNPTITEVQKIKCPHHFLIKYKSEAERVYFSNLIISIVKKFEIKDFHIEEKKAFMQTKIFYNMHTLTVTPNIKYEELEKTFLQYFEE